jgi:hypothetical protein
MDNIVVAIHVCVLIELVQAPATGCRQAPGAGWDDVVAALRQVAGRVEGRLPSTRCAMPSICIALAEAARAACRTSLPVLRLILLEACGRLSSLLKKESWGSETTAACCVTLRYR